MEHNYTNNRFSGGELLVYLGVVGLLGYFLGLKADGA